jgi:hypothetical protein
MRQNETHQGETPLSQRQQVALPHIAAHNTFSAGAEAADIGRATLSRWMNDDKFRIELTRMRQEASDLAFVELQRLMLKSIGILDDCLDDEAHDGTRLNAVRIALSSGIRANDSRILKKRLDIIEDGISNLKAQR